MSQAPCPSRRQSQQGFTLIEIVIALLLLGILASMLVTVLGTSFTNSSQPVFRLQQTMALQQTMENIRADFSKIGLFDLRTNIANVQHGNFDIYIGNTKHSPYVYEVIQNEFITFNTNYEEEPVLDSACDSNPSINQCVVLKVTIKDPGTGMELTDLFVQ